MCVFRRARRALFDNNTEGSMAFKTWLGIIYEPLRNDGNGADDDNIK